VLFRSIAELKYLLYEEVNWRFVHVCSTVEDNYHFIEFIEFIDSGIRCRKYSD